VEPTGRYEGPSTNVGGIRVAPVLEKYVEWTFFVLPAIYLAKKISSLLPPRRTKPRVASTMTCRDLWVKVLTNVKKCKVSLSTLKGSTIAVDISIWLHQILASVDEVATSVTLLLSAPLLPCSMDLSVHTSLQTTPHMCVKQPDM